MPDSPGEGLLNLNGDADDGLGAMQPKVGCWNRIRAKHAVIGMISIGLILTTITLIQLSTISYALIQVQQTLPDTISGYTDDMLQKAEGMIEQQIDGVVEKVGNDIKDNFYTEMNNVFIPETITKMQEQLEGLMYKEFGNEFQFRDMVARLEKLVKYACRQYPEACT